METSPLICRSNQWTGFYLMGNFVMKELNLCKRSTGFYMIGTSVMKELTKLRIRYVNIPPENFTKTV